MGLEELLRVRGFVRVRLYFDLDSRSAGSMPCEDAACVASSAAGVLREHISRFIFARIVGTFFVVTLPVAVVEAVAV